MLWRLVRRTVNENWIEHGLVLGALGGLCGFMASAMVHYNFGDSEVAIMFLFHHGIVSCAGRSIENGFAAREKTHYKRMSKGSARRCRIMRRRRFESASFATCR
jgi:hypothetical protein